MQTIEKKIKDEYFRAIKEGDKKHEFRLADFVFGVDDKLILLNEDTKEEIKFYVLDFRFYPGEILLNERAVRPGYEGIIDIMKEFHDPALIFQYGLYAIKVPNKEKWL